MNLVHLGELRLAVFNVFANNLSVIAFGLAGHILAKWFMGFINSTI